MGSEPGSASCSRTASSRPDNPPCVAEGQACAGGAAHRRAAAARGTCQGSKALSGRRTCSRATTETSFESNLLRLQSRASADLSSAGSSPAVLTATKAEWMAPTEHRTEHELSLHEAARRASHAALRASYGSVMLCSVTARADASSFDFIAGADRMPALQGLGRGPCGGRGLEVQIWTLQKWHGRLRPQIEGRPDAVALEPGCLASTGVWGQPCAGRSPTQ
eukprot:scaffold6174_cov125-Isochrysis_galbana.AAC.19